MASSISASDTRVVRSTSDRMMGQVSDPGTRTRSPSAMVSSGGTATRSPSAIERWKAGLASGSTAMISALGQAARIATAQPAITPPPLTGAKSNSLWCDAIHGSVRVRGFLASRRRCRAAAEQLVTREEALLAFARFEAKVSAPERLLDRRCSGHLGRGCAARLRCASGWWRRTEDYSDDGKARARRRSLAFHGELYRRKMRTDEGQLRQIFLRQQRVVAEVDEVEVDDGSLRPAGPPR